MTDTSLPLGPTDELPNGSSDSKLESELTSSISSELDMPGTVPNLTSSGRISPHRVRPLRDQETHLQEFKKENFGLKLRIYHLEEALRKRHGDLNEDWEMNIRLNVEVDEMKQKMADREMLLRDAKNGIYTLEGRVRELESELAEAKRISDELPYLQDALRRAQEEIEENRLRALEAERLANEAKQRAQLLEDDNEQLRKQLSEAVLPQPLVERKNREVQTEEPVGYKIKALEEELLEKQREINQLQESCEIKDKKIQELELELLRVTNKMATMASEHAQQMQTLTDQINELKTFLQERDEQLRLKDQELSELNRQIRELQRQIREVSETAEHLRNKLNHTEEECLEKEREIEELRRRLRDLQDEVDKLKSIINRLEKCVRDKDEEIENLKRQLRQKEDELSTMKNELTQLRGQLAEKDKALSAARTAAHSTNMNAQEKSSQVTHLLSEVERLKDELQQETRLKNEAVSSAAAKDELILQLRRGLEDLQKKLSNAEEKILQMTAAHAAEKGVLQSSIEDLTRQLELKEAAARNLRSEVAQLRGENEALRRELDRMRGENADLVSQLDDFEQQVKEKDQLLDQAERTIASLQKALDELSQNNDKPDGVSNAEVAKLRARLEAQEQIIKSKDSEIASLRQAVLTKDKIILDLQQELEKAIQERRSLEEALLTLNNEKEQLEIRVKILEDSANQNSDAFEQAKRAVEQLQDQVHRLEIQLREMSQSPHKISVSVDSTPQKTPPEQNTASPSSTTMIIGGMSENLLLLILQKLDELYREMMAGRSEGTNANSSLFSKMDEVTKLQKHFRSLLHKGKDETDPLELHEALMREIESLRSELEDYKRKEKQEEINTGAGDFSGILDELQRDNEHLIHELELEREKAHTEGEHKVFILEEQLKESRRKIKVLEKQVSDMSQLQRELDGARAECASLRGRLEAEEDHNRRMRSEVTELRLSNLQHMNDITASSLPDLHSAPSGSPHRKGGHWTTTTSSYTLGDHPDLNELIERHREVTRLNEEIQSKCEQKLKLSPPSQRPTSASHVTSFWQTRLKDQERALRTEMQEKERRMSSRLRHLEDQLRANEEQRERLQNRLTAALTTSTNREQEIISMSSQLQASRDKVKRLEDKLSVMLKEKNRKIQELEERISDLLQTRGMYAPSADGELRALRKSNLTLREEKSILISQLNSCQDQISALTKELDLYQQLLNDSTTGITVSSGAGISGSESSDKVRQLLEEIKALRRQLEQSINNNATLSKHLTHRLSVHEDDEPLSEDSSFDVSYRTPKLPSHSTNSTLRRKQDTSFQVTSSYITPSSHIPSGTTPFVPYATSTVNGGSKTQSKIRTGAGIHSAGMRLEDRIIKALNSPTSAGMDREFLRELLVYLQQQRSQLDDSQRLLDRLEKSQEIPPVTHISVTTTHDDDDDEQGERSCSRTSSVDLSVIHDQLRRTQTALQESKNLLRKKQGSSS